MGPRSNGSPAARAAVAALALAAVAVVLAGRGGAGGQRWRAAGLPRAHRAGRTSGVPPVTQSIVFGGSSSHRATFDSGVPSAERSTVSFTQQFSQGRPHDELKWWWWLCPVAVCALLWLRHGLRRPATRDHSIRLLTLSGITDPDPCPVLPGPLSEMEAHQFLRDGHLFVPQLLDADFISSQLAPEIRAWHEANQLASLRHAVQTTLGGDNVATLSLEECRTLLAGHRDPEAVPFLQSFNVWQTCPAARRLALSPALGRIAAQLLDVPAVRLYQDSVFVKRSGDGPTEWHSDLNMAPFDTNAFVTCWVPLQPVPAAYDGGTGLCFATASHRDFALPFWSDPRETDVSDRYDVVEGEALEVGDCTFHHGWVLHFAPGNPLPEARMAYCVSYVADGARLLQREGHLRYPDGEDYPSYQAWVEEVGWGEAARHPLLPLVYTEVDPEAG
eukprot:EG_transcript_12370